MLALGFDMAQNLSDNRSFLFPLRIAKTGNANKYPGVLRSAGHQVEAEQGSGTERAVFLFDIFSTCNYISYRKINLLHCIGMQQALRYNSIT
ncbi:hypothetical protein [Paenibacillus sp. P3E]|uniref:hypothetical protein n=1 Tax=Paenibacillus sp. P3E TaxID=1349435 RepID=UPI001C4A5324|nr:hypothetical protein [Paenibacillus sp. P3E]